MRINLCLPGALIAAFAVSAPAAAEQSQQRVIVCKQIKTATQLQAMRNNLGASYCLANDIDAGTIANFKPVGTAANKFTGRLFGNNHVISNLTINSAAADVGMFGSIDGAVIQDLALVNVNVRGRDAYVGGLVGTAYGDSAASRIARISVTGLVRSFGSSSAGGIAGLLNDNVVLTQSRSAAQVLGGTSNEVGGVVAKNAGTIQQSYATGAITGGRSSDAGGLVGTNDPTGLVQRCYATGAVTAGDESNVGGLIGTTFLAGGTVLQSYAAGPVTAGADSRTGGLIGQQNGGSITEGYAVGPVSAGAGSSVGGLIGQVAGSPIVMNSYWDTQTSGQATSGGGLGGGLMTTPFRAELPPGFSDVWALTETLSYPFLNDIDIDFASPLATLVRASEVFVFVPISQLDASQYMSAPLHADEASLAAVYTMLARAAGITDNDAGLKDVKIDRYFWDDATQTATFTGPVRAYVKLGPLTAIPAATPLDTTNVIARMNGQKLVIMRGAYRKSDDSVATHWMLGTLYTKAGDGVVSTVVAHDPFTGAQVEIDPATKRVLTPGFPLANFKVNGYQAAVVN